MVRFVPSEIRRTFSRPHVVEHVVAGVARQNSAHPAAEAPAYNGLVQSWPEIGAAAATACGRSPSDRLDR
ncbi:MAG: hypothetical protein M3365_08010 [Gemmatimonadota bacterium]|nr:hypothetical protein [Gemmatimonadota bacterium]